MKKLMLAFAAAELIRRVHDAVIAATATRATNRAMILRMMSSHSRPGFSCTL